MERYEGRIWDAHEAQQDASLLSWVPAPGCCLPCWEIVATCLSSTFMVLCDGKTSLVLLTLSRKHKSLSLLPICFLIEDILQVSWTHLYKTGFCFKFCYQTRWPQCLSEELSDNLVYIKMTLQLPICMTIQWTLLSLESTPKTQISCDGSTQKAEAGGPQV